MISPEQRRLLLIVQEGIPLTPQPFREIAERLGSSEERVLALLRSLMEQGVIKRLAALPNHYALGITANGMAVWDVPDEIVSEVGPRLGQRPEVTHCYRRPRAPAWPYNLFAMVHGMSKGEVLAKIQRLNQDLALERYPHDVLFSTRLLKKTGTRVRDEAALYARED